MKYLLVTFCFIGFGSSAQIKKEKTLLLYSTYNMYPDSFRNTNPRIYNQKIYNSQQHYNDSSVLVYFPSRFNKKKPFKIVVWIHGWYANIDSVFKHFPIKEAIDSCEANYILLLPEGPRNAPDSYAGKWEKPNYFNWFVSDVQQQLIQQRLLSKPTNNFIYAGHSGAYKAIANMLHWGSVNCQAVLLFDALYGETDTYFQYIKNNPNCYFYNVYCKDGGTYKNSIDFSANLKINNLPSCDIQEEDIANTTFRDCKIAHIYSKLSHNNVIKATNYFKLILQNIK